MQLRLSCRFGSTFDGIVAGSTRDNPRVDDTAEIVVPAAHLFVMGDNRDNSADSRVPLAQGGVGLLPMDNLVGRVDAIVGSWDLGIRNRPMTEWMSGLRLSRFVTGVR